MTRRRSVFVGRFGWLWSLSLSGWSRRWWWSVFPFGRKGWSFTFITMFVGEIFVRFKGNFVAGRRVWCFVVVIVVSSVWWTDFSFGRPSTVASIAVDWMSLNFVGSYTLWSWVITSNLSILFKAKHWFSCSKNVCSDVWTCHGKQSERTLLGILSQGKEDCQEPKWKSCKFQHLQWWAVRQVSGTGCPLSCHKKFKAETWLENCFAKKVCVTWSFWCKRVKGVSVSQHTLSERKRCEGNEVGNVTEAAAGKVVFQPKRLE